MKFYTIYSEQTTDKQTCDNSDSSDLSLSLYANFNFFAIKQIIENS